jgi:hypothetical protein
LEDLRAVVQDKKMAYAGWSNGVCRLKQRHGIEYGQMWSEFRRRQWQITPVQLNFPRKSSVGSPGV